MATYRTPGAYVEESPSLPSASASVDTAVPVFVGYTELHDANVPSTTSDSTAYPGSGTVTTPVKVNSMKEFVELFGGTAHSVTVQFSVPTGPYVITYNANPASTVPFNVDVPTTRKFFLYYSLQWYFANGGGPCYVSSVGVYSAAGPNKANLARAFENSLGTAPLELVVEPTLVIAPDLLGIDGTGATALNNYYGVAQLALAHCAAMENRFCLLDVYTIPSDSDYDEWSEVSAAFKSQIGAQHLDRAAAYGPLVESSLRYQLNKDRVVFAQQGGSGAFPDGKTLAELEAEIATNANGEKAAVQNMLTSQFYSEIEKSFAAQRDSEHPVLGPASAAAAIISVTDQERGIHKAPANRSLQHVTAPVERFSQSDLDDMNDPLDGKAVNVIREISGRGAVLMGARTLDANSPVNRFISNRRTLLLLEANIRTIVNGALLLPNVQVTWMQVKAQLEGYLHTLWREGMLFGRTASEAYSVTVGVPPPTVAIPDVLNVQVGLSLSRPAEFVIAQFSFNN